MLGLVRVGLLGPGNDDAEKKVASTISVGGCQTTVEITMWKQGRTFEREED